jgi:chaperone modulatory protein CbpM
MTHAITLIEAHMIDERDFLAVETLCRLCGLKLEALIELAELGVVAPRGYAPANWELPATSLPTLRTVGRLMRDLDVNVSGAAVVVELLETQRRLERRLLELEQHLRGPEA